MNSARKYNGIPFQIRWTPELKREFESMIKRYDPLLSMNNAIIKLVMDAVKKNWLPGYEKQDRIVRSGTEINIQTSGNRGMPERIIDKNRRS